MTVNLKAPAALAAVSVLLTGCTFGASIDTLMTPPKLSREQEEIYSALTDAAGESISLKYPKSGGYLSAFIVEDLDSDGGDEAVVFYEKNGASPDETYLRINILDRYPTADGGNEWRSVYDTPADGAEIERVMIATLGSNERTNLIIGSSQINRSEKTLSVYSYSDGVFEKTFSEAYSYFDLTDLDSSGENELLLLSGAAAADSYAAAAAYRLDEEGLYHQYLCDLSGGFTEFGTVSYGTLRGGGTGLYIDAASGSGFIQTDIVRLSEDGLSSAFSNQEISGLTVRQSGCASADIDGDGEVEIPVQTVSPGYEDVPEGEQLRLTSWQYLTSAGRLERKYTSYYSTSDGYVFLFPEKWRGRVTVRRDAVNDELVFCAYSSETGEMGRELLRIYCAEDLASREDRISMGYMLLRTSGDLSYLAYIPTYTAPATDSLSITAADAAIGFAVI